MVICDQTTWVPYFSLFATTCHQLRLLYFQYNLLGAGGNGLGGRNCAAIFYRRQINGNLCHVTNSSESGVGAARHSERVCYDEMMAREVAMPPVIEFVYTERFPCGPQNQNCLNFLHQNFPNGMPVFWSFDWPDAADLGISRNGDRKGDAKKRRADGTRDLKHYQRDIDYRGASSFSGTRGFSARLGGTMACRVESASDAWKENKALPLPMPMSFA